MRLYKIVRLSGSVTRSIFPPRAVEPLPLPEWAGGDPWRELVRRLMLRGYTFEQAGWILQAWAHHAKYDLNQLQRGIIVYCQMMERNLPVPPIPGGVSFWPFVLLAAAVLTIGLALYLWDDPEDPERVVKAGHDWAYLLQWEERLWQGEIRRVTGAGIGIYEQGGEFGSVIVEHTRNNVLIDRRLDTFGFYGSMVNEGRPLVFWHRYYWEVWNVFFCGVVERVKAGLYILREGGRDPYRPPVGWIRPGDRWGTTGYDGCWKRYWWAEW